LENFEQMDIFDFIEPTEPARPNPKPVVEETFKIGEKVRIKKLQEIDVQVSIEDSTLLVACGGKKGIIADIHLGSVVSYFVQIPSGESHYFYARELILLG